jgi:hypothetical protein
MKNKTLITAALILCFTASGCATMNYRQFEVKDDIDRQAEAYLENMRKYTDANYVKKVVQNTAYPGIDYMMKKALNTQEKKEKYDRKMSFIGGITLAGMLLGGIWGYAESRKNYPEYDLVHAVGAACGVVIGSLPGCALYGLAQVGTIASSF